MMEEITCTQQLLNMVAHGNAVIAELLRLKDNIPQIFRLETKEEQSKYGDIILDFVYFKNSDAIEKRISNNLNLQELDDECKETNLSIITRFYSAFESVYQYVTDLNLFLEQLNDGSFIQHTLDTILQDNEGKQLLCESIYLYGCMLLVCEVYIPGNLRERLLVAYHRAAVSHLQTNLDSVCKLLRDTGYRNIQGTKRPNNYPDELFRRIPIDDSFVKIIIGRLISEDIYNQITIYPSPDHRSTALSSQAAMLVICLFFSTNILLTESAKMREIVDKYFPDNWTISLYMGITINLIDTWEPYKAAKLALANTINSKNIRDLSQKYVEQMKKLHNQTEKLLKGKVLKEENLMDNINKILRLIKECNVTLRWLMIHTTSPTFHETNKKCRQIRDQIISESKFNSMDLFHLLINTSLLEIHIKDMLKTLLDNKEIKLQKQKKEAYDRILELSEVFSGTKPLARVDKNESLCNWFKAISRQIDSLNQEDTLVFTKKIIQLVQALEDVQEFHQLDDIMQVKQWLTEARSNLKDMIRGEGVTEESIVALQVCTDLSYGWYAARPFINLGRDALSKDPNVVSHMRAIFLKLASALEIPLLRINQASSPDLLSVSQYYSSELVSYVKDVLQIIPEKVFNLLERIIELQTSVIKELPTRLDKDKLKDYAQLEERMEVAKLTHSVSVFTSGILKMRSTLVGVICIDPKQLLEDGIRCEVSKLVAARLKNSLCSNVDGALPVRLTQLAHHMDGYRRSFEYIQDYINIHGLKIWQEEVSKIVNIAAEDACCKASRLKPFQMTLSIFSKDSNIFSSLLQDMYMLVDPKTTIYVEHNNSWYDYKSHKEVVTMTLFKLIHHGINPIGLRGFSRLIGCCIASRLAHIHDLIQAALPLPAQFPITNPRLPIANSSKVYTQLSSKASKNWNQLLDFVLEVGMAQLILKHTYYQLNTACKFESKHLEASLKALNESLINAIKVKLKKQKESNAEIPSELVEMMYSAGITDAYDTIYTVTKNNNNVAQVIFLFVIAQLSKLEYIQFSSTIMAKKATNHIDGAPFLIGIITVLKQYHEHVLLQFIVLFCQYIVSYIDTSLNLKTPEFPSEIQVALKFLENLCHVTKIPYIFIEDIIPRSILLQYQFMSSKSI